jgi:hypothetical protein
VGIRRLDDAIVHPFTFPSRANDARPAQVRQMPRNFWLTLSQYFNKETHAHFVVSDEVEQAQTRLISESAKQLVHIELHSRFGHAPDSSSERICLALCIKQSYTAHMRASIYKLDGRGKPDPNLEGEKK